MARARSRFVGATAVAVAGLSLLLWFLLRFRLPLVVTVSAWPEAARLAPWTWHVDSLSWQLTGALLLLVTAVLLATRSYPPRDSGQHTPPSEDLTSGRGFTMVLLLTAASLPAVWANTVAGVMTGWVLLAGVWLLYLLGSGTLSRDVAGLRPKVGWLLLPLFFLWLAATTAPSDSLDAGGWQPVPVLSIMVAVILQMGIWPLYGWRPRRHPAPPATAALVQLIPTAAGLALLVRLVAATGMAASYGLLLTIVGLLGMLAGIRRAWTRLQIPLQMVIALLLAQGGVVVLAAIWAGAAAALAEGRVLLLAGGILFLATARARPSLRRWQQVAPLVALAALAGFPLTAGFAGRVALYEAWLQNGRFVLVLAAALLHIPLVTAVLLLVWPQDSPPVEDTAGITLPAALYEVATLLPALGLFTIGGVAEAGAVTWLALLLPVVGGGLLFRLADRLHGAYPAIHQAFSIDLSLADRASFLRSVGRGLVAAIRQAALILEGEGGLLWLLALVIIFIVAR